MKRTTYILIGLFIAGLCVLVGGMFMMFCLGRPYFSNQLNLQGEQLTKEVPVCRVIWLTQTEMSTESYGRTQCLAGKFFFGSTTFKGKEEYIFLFGESK